MKKNLLITLCRPLILLLMASVFLVLPVNSQSTNNYSDTNLDGYSDGSSVLLIKPSSDLFFNPADTGDVIHTIPTPGGNSQALTWDGNYLWCSDIFTDSIYKLDPVDGTVIKSFIFPGDLVEGLAWDGTNLWASDQSSDIIYKFDPEDGSVISSLQLSEVWIHGITWDGQYLWMNDFENKVILKIDPETGDILHSINAPGLGSIGLTWDGIHLWADDFNTDKLYCIDPLDGTIIYEFYAPSGNPRDLAWDGEYLWVMSAINWTIYQIDAGVVIGVENLSPMPENVISFSVYPNPFVDVLNIEFEISRISKISIEIYDQNGILIYSLVNKDYSPGKQKVKWYGNTNTNRDLSSGIYYCVLQSGSEKTSRKFIFTRRN